MGRYPSTYKAILRLGGDLGSYVPQCQVTVGFFLVVAMIFLIFISDVRRMPPASLHLSWRWRFAFFCPCRALRSVGVDVRNKKIQEDHFSFLCRPASAKVIRKRKKKRSAALVCKMRRVSPEYSRGWLSSQFRGFVVLAWRSFLCPALHYLATAACHGASHLGRKGRHSLVYPTAMVAFWFFMSQSPWWTLPFLVFAYCFTSYLSDSMVSYSCFVKRQHRICDQASLVRSQAFSLRREHHRLYSTLSRGQHSFGLGIFVPRLPSPRVRLSRLSSIVGSIVVVTALLIQCRNTAVSCFD